MVPFYHILPVIACQTESPCSGRVAVHPKQVTAFQGDSPQFSRATDARSPPSAQTSGRRNTGRFSLIGWYPANCRASSIPPRTRTPKVPDWQSVSSRPAGATPVSRKRIPLWCRPRISGCCAATIRPRRSFPKQYSMERIRRCNPVDFRSESCRQSCSLSCCSAHQSNNRSCPRKG